MEKHLGRRGCRSNGAAWVRVGVALSLVAAHGSITGCGGSRVPQERVIPIRRADALVQLRSYLEGYAQGQPVGSERELFPQVVDEIRKSDSDLATALEKGLADIQAAPGQAAGYARRLLDRLGPDRDP